MPGTALVRAVKAQLLDMTYETAGLFWFVAMSVAVPTESIAITQVPAFRKIAEREEGKYFFCQMSKQQ